MRQGAHLISESSETHLEPRVDALVDGYLAGFGAAIATKRQELAIAFRDAAPVSELSDRILKKILRQNV